MRGSGVLQAHCSVSWTARSRAKPEAFIILESAAQHLDVDGIIGVNDELGHAAVMQMYNKAIEIAQKPWVPHQNSRS
jgi:hypothetical protein